jgi:glycolate oxidase iron-sulfur subunit
MSDGLPRSFVDDCVHCGFCLPACPTYVSWGHEEDSPRGRIHLMRALESGRIPLVPEVSVHFDRCLGCMACLPACPSGVRYDVLLEKTRARIEREVPRPAMQAGLRRLVFALFPHPGRLRLLLPLLYLAEKSGLLSLARRIRLPGRLSSMAALAPAVTAHHLTASLPPVTPAMGTRRMRVGLVTGCVQKIFFPGVNEATVRVLSAEGCEVVVPPGQGCCGALSAHSGRDAEAREMAKALIARFEAAGVDRVVLNAAGCGSTAKEYVRLLEGEPGWRERAAAFASKARDVSEFLAELPPVARRNPLRLRVAYHDACHLAHAQGVRSQPRALLSAIPGLTLLEVPDGDQCCGSAGIYNIVEPGSAREIGERKAENVLSVAPDLLASANPGCTLQVQQILRSRGRSLPTAHPIEILDASIRGTALAGTIPSSGFP